MQQIENAKEAHTCTPLTKGREKRVDALLNFAIAMEAERMSNANSAL